MHLPTLVARELDAERIFVPTNGPTFRRAMSTAEWAQSQGLDPRVAARWAVVRVTQFISLEERAKLR